MSTPVPVTVKLTGSNRVVPKSCDSMSVVDTSTRARWFACRLRANGWFRRPGF